MERPQLGFAHGKWNGSSATYGAPDVLFNGVCDGPLSCLGLDGKGMRYMTWTLARPLAPRILRSLNTSVPAS